MRSGAKTALIIIVFIVIVAICAFILLREDGDGEGTTSVKPTTQEVTTEHNHAVDEALTKTKEINSASCEEDGSAKVTKYCSCGKAMSETTETIPALGHDYEKNVIEPTCTSKGYTALVCNNCGNEVIDEDSYTDPIAHDFQDGYCIYCGEKGVNPCYLADMEVWDKDLEDGDGMESVFDINEYKTDRYKNSYTTSVSINTDGSVTYLLNGDYKTFSGTIACPEGYKTQSYLSNVIITIHGDGNTLFTSSESGPTTEPQSFSVSVKGVEKLTISKETLEAHNIWNSWGYYGTIFDGKLE